jgi:hypothetical protein
MVVPGREQSASPPMSGTGRIVIGYSGDLLNRTSTGIPKNRPLLIGLGKLVATTFKIKQSKNRGDFACPHETKSCARDRLQSATPICDDASLLKLNREVAEYVRKAKRGDHSRPDELVSTVVDGVARSYFSYILRKQARVTPVRRRTRA